MKTAYIERNMQFTNIFLIYASTGNIWKIFYISLTLGTILSFVQQVLITMKFASKIAFHTFVNIYIF